MYIFPAIEKQSRLSSKIMTRTEIQNETKVNVYRAGKIVSSKTQAFCFLKEHGMVYLEKIRHETVLGSISSLQMHT